MNKPENIWPEFLEDEDKIARPPIALINEYAQELPARTANYVVAKVLKLNSKTSQQFSYSMVLSSPALGGYSFRMFDIHYSVEMYPLALKIDEAIMEELKLPSYNGSEFYRVVDEPSLKSVLGLIFASNKVRKIVRALIAQAKEVGIPNNELDF